MATGVTLTNTRTGRKAFLPKEIVHLLKQASKDYRADAAGMKQSKIKYEYNVVFGCIKAEAMLQQGWRVVMFTGFDCFHLERKINL
jgi:hypothetical protein